MTAYTMKNNYAKYAKGRCLETFVNMHEENARTIVNDMSKPANLSLPNNGLVSMAIHDLVTTAYS